MSLPKLARKWLGFLPRSWRHEMMRRSFRLRFDWPEEFQLKLATTESEFEEAFRLVHDAYVEAGYMDPDPTGMRILPQHLMPQASVLIALWEGRVVGTATLVRDNPMGLSMERVFDLKSARIKGKRIGEVTCLAIDKDFRKGLDRVFFPLLKFVYHYARSRFGIQRLVAAVHTSTIDMYQGILGIHPMPGEERPFGFLKDAPAVALSVDLDQYPESLEELYDQHSSATDLSKYLTSVSSSRQFGLPERDFHHISDAMLTPRLLRDFFFGKARMRERLSEEDLLTLVQQYPHSNYARVLDLRQEEPRRDWRIETRLPARLDLNRLNSEVWDVSRGGLKLMSGEDLAIGKRVTLKIGLNRSVQAHLDAEVCWAAGKIFGLKILTANSAWEQMIRSLEDRLERSASRCSDDDEVTAKIVS